MRLDLIEGAVSAAEFIRDYSDFKIKRMR